MTRTDSCSNKEFSASKVKTISPDLLSLSCAGRFTPGFFDRNSAPTSKVPDQLPPYALSEPSGHGNHRLHPRKRAFFHRAGQKRFCTGPDLECYRTIPRQSERLNYTKRCPHYLGELVRIFFVTSAPYSLPSTNKCDMFVPFLFRNRAAMQSR